MRPLAIRVSLTAAALILWFWTQHLIGARSLPATGIADGLLTLTAPLNHYLHVHPAIANALLILSSAIIDLVGDLPPGEVGLRRHSKALPRPIDCAGTTANHAGARGAS